MLMRMTQIVGMTFITGNLRSGNYAKQPVPEQQAQILKKMLYKAHNKYLRLLLMAYPPFRAVSVQHLPSREVPVTEAGKSRTRVADKISSSLHQPSQLGA